MIADDNYVKIDRCLEEKYGIRDAGLESYDELVMITCFPTSADTPEKVAIAIVRLEQAEYELKNMMFTEIMIHSAITPQAIAIAERLQEARVDLDRLRGNDPIDNLSLLCFALSHNLKWLRELAQKHKPKHPPDLTLDYDYDNDLPF